VDQEHGQEEQTQEGRHSTLHDVLRSGSEVPKCTSDATTKTNAAQLLVEDASTQGRALAAGQAERGQVDHVPRTRRFRGR
jgi:hypothetical protein